MTALNTFPTPHPEDTWQGSNKAEQAVERRLDVILSTLDGAKADNIAIIDLRGRASFAETMVIATALSGRHMGALARHLERALKEECALSASAEGSDSSDWTLLDTGDIVIHLFSPEGRTTYGLERMWNSALDVADAEEVVIPKAGR
ncbi:ribosome silencing factor [Formicincola oecophyllae]|uniref:Ribosomal silencing factor RsfS n=2 Tax=Formicincola oecophyllae TaxID=2558361 RepID=A0A4Y6U8F9_9PROT|nr:ribosome silencing factor [Formicincola oecophyllae]